MKTTNLNRIGVVVADLDATVAEYQRVYGITDWTFTDNAPADAVCHGRRTQLTPGTWRSALGTTSPRPGEVGPGGTPAYPVTFELIQPTGGESPFAEQLLATGPGIAFIQVRAEAAAGESVDAHFAGLGIPAAYSATVGEQRRTFWDTRGELGGFLVEMVEELEPLNQAQPIADAVTVVEAPQPIQGIYHFGVLVHDVMAALPHYRDIFGITTFDMKLWETAEGRLDAPQYRGDTSPVGYFTAQGTAGDFGFEIISMKYGSCHYNREFFDDRGPGIHHFFGWMAKEEEPWQEVVADMTAAGHPLIMGSPLRAGAAEFGYFDTFDALGGYLIEIVIRRFQGAPEHMAPDWVVDYAELETAGKEA